MAIRTSKLRAVFEMRRRASVGLTEIEAWSPRKQAADPPPSDNLALNPSGWSYPRATASFEFLGDPQYRMNDGDRQTYWSSFKCRSSEPQWAQIDFGTTPRMFRQVQILFQENREIAPPAKFELHSWSPDGTWHRAVEQSRTSTPDGAIVVNVMPTVTHRVRVVLMRQRGKQVGIREIEIR